VPTVISYPNLEEGQSLSVVGTELNHQVVLGGRLSDMGNHPYLISL